MANTRGSPGRSTAFAVADHGARAAIGYGDGPVQVWSTRNRRPEPVSLDPQPDTVTSVSFDGEQLLTASDPEVRMFNLTEPAPATERLTVPAGGYQAVETRTGPCETAEERARAG